MKSVSQLRNWVPMHRRIGRAYLGGDYAAMRLQAESRPIVREARTSFKSTIQPEM